MTGDHVHARLLASSYSGLLGGDIAAEFMSTKQHGCNCNGGMHLKCMLARGACCMQNSHKIILLHPFDTRSVYTCRHHGNTNETRHHGSTGQHDIQSYNFALNDWQNA